MDKGKIRILAIDDEEKTLNEIKNICQEDHFKVITETSATKALEIIRDDDRQFDIIIVDYVMVEMTGIDFLRELKKIYLKDTYIPMLCTGSGTTHLFQEEFKDLLFYYFLEKPIDIVIAKRTIEKAVHNINLLRAGKTWDLGKK